MKRGLIGLLIFTFVSVLMVGVVFAVNETNSSSSSTSSTSSTSSSSSSNLNSGDAVDRGYACLEDQIKDKTSLSLQEAIFSTLAVGKKANLEKIITDNKRSNEECWPKEGCKLKDTAQVLLTYNRIGTNTDKIEQWILSKNATATDLNWYLEIDVQNHVSSQCTITYDGSDKKIQIKDDMKLSGNPGSCLTITSSGYWLRIKDNCLDKTFSVSCDQDFITTLLYEKSSGGTIYVSSETHSAASLGKTEEKVNAQCLKSGTVCDYEGTLWSALALQKSGNDISKFKVYLVALAEDNKRFFPSSFLYLLYGLEDQYSETIQSQKQGQYWQQAGTPYSRFYDTSLGMLALSSSSSGEFDAARQYLLKIQEKSGCWNSNNIRDTAFLLYSGWPKTISNGGGGTSGGGVLCENSGKYCEGANSCLDAGGVISYDLDCPRFGEFCCSVNIQELTCAEQNGRVCPSNQECSGSVLPSVEGSCCVGTCQEIEVEETCVIFGGICRSSCFEGEEEGSEVCSGGDVCCQEVIAPSKGISIWIWIVILAILILLVLIALYYRNKLRILWYRWRGGASVKPVERRGPPGGAGFTPPVRPMQRPGFMFGRQPMRPNPAMQRPTPPPPRPVAPSRPASVSKSAPSKVNPSKDSEFEETMKKLREMSK